MASPQPLQALDYTSLMAVLQELTPLLLPSRFEKAQQSDSHTLQLGLRGLQGSLWLELSWLAEAPRLLAIPPPPRQGDGSTLAQQLQHGLRGLALVALHQPAWERVVELRFAPRPGEAVERILLLELMGRHSNLFLLDAERRVIALARQVRGSQSRLRPIGTGDAYQSPPPQAGEPPRQQESFEVWQQRLQLLPLPLGRALLGAYQGTSPALLRQLLEAAPAIEGQLPLEASLPVTEMQPGQWQWLWRRWQGWLAALEQQRFTLQWQAGGGYRCWIDGAGEPRWLAHQPGASPAEASAPAEAGSTAGGIAAAAQGIAVGASPDPAAAAPQQQQAVADPASPAPGPVAADPASSALGDRAAQGGPDPLAINRGLAAYYDRILSARRWRQRQQALGSRLRAALEREQGQLQQQQELLAAVPAADGLQQQADALLCRPDPDRATIDQAQALYRRARKLRRSVAAITPRIALHRQRLADLETSSLFLEQLEDGAALEALEPELLEQLERLRPQPVASSRGRGRRRAAAQAEPMPLELCSAGGLRLQVGRNHRQNEWISLRQARRGDLWFHAQEQPGSHVVLKGSEATPQLADLQAAADLAAHFSRARGNRRVPVIMVPAETLQRIPGAEPGTVRHRGGELLWGEPERAQALLERSMAAESAAAAGRGIARAS